MENCISTNGRKEPKQKRNKPTVKIPRARKYYDKACELRKYNRESKHGLFEYSRIMLCLYMAIVNNHRKEIDDFDLSIGSLNITKIISSMKKEKASLSKKPRFDISDPYDSDRSTFIIMIIIYYCMKSNEVIGEY